MGYKGCVHDGALYPIPRPIDADWHMPVQSCSLLYRRQIWERCPYPAECRVIGDHVWFRRQMKLGLKLVSVRKPIGIFTWHEDDIAKRLGSHGENSLADVDLKSLRMRLTKLRFRTLHLLEGGLIRPNSMDLEYFGIDRELRHMLTSRPQLGL